MALGTQQYSHMPLAFIFLEYGDHYLSTALAGSQHQAKHRACTNKNSWVSTHRNCGTACHFALTVCPLRTVVTLGSLCLLTTDLLQRKSGLMCYKKAASLKMWTPGYNKPSLKKGHLALGHLSPILTLNLHVCHLFSFKQQEIPLSLGRFLTWTSRCGSFVVKALWQFHGVAI